MTKYPKINTIWKREMEGKQKGKLIEGKYSKSEIPNIKMWHITEKIHGTNIRVEFVADVESGWIDIQDLKFLGKTNNAEIPKNLLEHLTTTFDSERLSKMVHFKPNSTKQQEITLFGEGYGCFSNNTNVLLSDGTKKTLSEIVNQKIKTEVLTYNFEKNEIEESNILNYFKYPPQKLLKIELEKTHKGGRGRYNQIICTKNHLIYTSNGYKKAKELTINDVVMSLQQGLSFIQEQTILGTLLGDGYRFGDYGINISHSIKQTEYISLLKRIFSNINISESRLISGYGSKMIILTMSNKELFKDIIDVCYFSGKKRLNKSWLNRLTPLALAIWYMDDGSIDNLQRRNQRAELATQSFTINELKLLQSILYSKYGIKGTLKKSKTKTQYSLRFSTEESHIFFMLVSPFIIKSLKYKLPSCYKDMPCTFDYTENFLQESKALRPAKIKNISIDTNENRNILSVYDIETKNENYFVGSGFLVHNSKIQKGGGRYRDDVSFALFDVKIGEWWLEQDDVTDITQKIGIDRAPELGIMTEDEIVKLVKNGYMNKEFKSKISKDKTLDAEGIVARSYPLVLFKNGDPLMWKLKQGDFKK